MGNIQACRHFFGKSPGCVDLVDTKIPYDVSRTDFFTNEYSIHDRCVAIAAIVKSRIFQHKKAFLFNKLYARCTLNLAY
jgi:hypothetical protein